ncbi:PP2C family protein-serine/threonine phosphatase [Streptomyces sp. V1I6]|uniref:PP2C family protein-serine/threonine phosphatase n=1 Tax=Streptomyces sp. V1I6 TaxID=3042273 RepID=UPI0027D7A99E|nr:PP2C family protein-serine/threonine phosphatase [Streptomyces sp. V1I6]
MLVGLLADSHVMSFEHLPELVSRHAATAGVTDVQIYLGDLQRDVLRLLPTEGRQAERMHPAEVHVEGSVAGRAYQYGRITAGATGTDGAQCWWIPLLDGTERLGVLHVAARADDESAQETLLALASLVAMLVVSCRVTSDSYARLSRSKAMNVAAEMQWQLMPPRTYADGRVTIGAVMEPAYQVSGDAYDYAIAGDIVHLSVFDAMGHDTAAGLTANLAVGACRNRRRQGTGLADLGDAIETVILEQFGHNRYVTGILADLDTTTGVLTWISRGHHPPVVIRGGRWSSLLNCPPSHPMGSDLDLPTTVCREHLQPGDRVVLYTDGITEARTAAGVEFGLAAFVDFLIRHHADGLPVPETLRRLMRALRQHHNDRLQDDATILLCEWLGPERFSTASTAPVAGVPLPDH